MIERSRSDYYDQFGPLRDLVRSGDMDGTNMEQFWDLVGRRLGQLKTSNPHLALKYLGMICEHRARKVADAQLVNRLGEPGP